MYRTFTSSSEVAAKVGDNFQVPSRVMSTAVIDSVGVTINGDPGDRVYVLMHFTELQALNTTNGTRLITINGRLFEPGLFYDKYSPPFGEVDHKEFINASLDSSGSFYVTIYSSISSTLPPIVNAVETYYLKRIKWLPTHQGDGELCTMYSSRLSFIAFQSYPKLLT